MKKKMLAGLLLAGSTMFAAPRVSFGVGFGALCGWRLRLWQPCLRALARAMCSWMDIGDSGCRLARRLSRAPEHFEHFDRHAEHFRR